MGSDISGLEVLRFDDLTAPQLTDVQRQILEHTEQRRVDLDVNRMAEEAVAESGVNDFADTGGLWDRVAAYVGAIEADACRCELSYAGRCEGADARRCNRSGRLPVLGAFGVSVRFLERRSVRS